MRAKENSLQVAHDLHLHTALDDIVEDQLVALGLLTSHTTYRRKPQKHSLSDLFLSGVKEEGESSPQLLQVEMEGVGRTCDADDIF